MTVEAAPAGGRVWTRHDVWERLGAPDLQIGSVNDPRTNEEAGVRWNEKWVYWRPGTREPERVVLWQRYELRGVFRVDPDGSLEPEPLPAA